MIDLDAPIIPGKGAAGLVLNAQIEPILEENPGVFKSEKIVNSFVPVNLTRYRSPAVDLWEEDGCIVQIMVHSEYQGKLDSKIGIGSTVADIQHLYGQCEEDEDDNLIIKEIPGLYFDVTGSFPNKENPFDPASPMFREATVDWICVFEEPTKK